MNAIPTAGLALASLLALPAVAPAQEAAGPPATPTAERPTTTPGWVVRLAPGPDHAAGLARLAQLRRELGTALDEQGADLRTTRRAAFDAQLSDLRAGAAEARAAVAALVGERGLETLGATWLTPQLAVRDLDAATRAELAARPDVLAVDPIRWQLPAIGTAVDAAHHDAVGAWALSAGGVELTGHGVEIAVLDSGLDMDTSGKGRPHKAFFANGDPLDLSGGGIDGSRILTSVNFGGFLGTQPPGDIHGHGTRVASTIAAAKWSNGLDVDDSIAHDAWLHNFKISDDSMPGAAASTFDMSQALDAAVANPAIRIANLSYDGDDHPLYHLNLDIDGASNAGVLVVLSAGNNGSDLTFAHAAYNGLAVGSSYELSPFPYWTSAIGPLLDPQGGSPRRYPDMIANGDQISTAKLDAEHLYTLATGTSLAAGFVSGAAGLLFQADPGLTPTEAKALLLEHTWDIVSGNPAAGGLGYLRVKEAVEGALAGDVRGGTITADGSVEVRVDLTAGTPVRYTLAWERASVAPGQQATVFDLDLTVVDPAGAVVAASATDFDVEERVAFTPQTTGSYRLRIQEPGADGGDVAVAWALAGPGLGLCAGVEVDQVAPVVVPAVTLPGTPNPIELGGCGLDQVTAVLVGGQPVPFLAGSPESMQLDLAAVPVFGTTTLDLVHPGGTTSTTLEVGPAEPLVFGATVLPVSGPSTLYVASQPGDLHLLFAAPDQQPSLLPGIVGLNIGSGFTTLFQIADLHVPPGQAYQTWSVQPPVAIPFGQVFYLQSAVLGPSSPTLPVAVSNVHEVSIAP